MSFTDITGLRFYLSAVDGESTVDVTVDKLNSVTTIAGSSSDTEFICHENNVVYPGALLNGNLASFDFPGGVPGRVLSPVVAKQSSTTICVVFEADSIADDNYVFTTRGDGNHDDLFDLRCRNAKFDMRIGGNINDTGVAWTTGTPHVFIGRWDVATGVVDCFVNNEQRPLLTGMTTDPEMVRFSLGDTMGGSTTGLDGRISIYAVYERALKDQECSDLYDTAQGYLSPQPLQTNTYFGPVLSSDTEADLKWQVRDDVDTMWYDVDDATGGYTGLESRGIQYSLEPVVPDGQSESQPDNQLNIDSALYGQTVYLQCKATTLYDEIYSNVNTLTIEGDPLPPFGYYAHDFTAEASDLGGFVHARESNACGVAADGFIKTVDAGVAVFPGGTFVSAAAGFSGPNQGLQLEPELTNLVENTDILNSYTPGSANPLTQINPHPTILAPDGSDAPWLTDISGGGCYYSASNFFVSGPTSTVWARLIADGQTSEDMTLITHNAENARFTVTDEWARYSFDRTDGNGADYFYPTNSGNLGTQAVNEALLWGPCAADGHTIYDSWVPATFAAATRAAASATLDLTTTDFRQDMVDDFCFQVVIDQATDSATSLIRVFVLAATNDTYFILQKNGNDLILGSPDFSPSITVTGGAPTKHIDARVRAAKTGVRLYTPDGGWSLERSWTGLSGTVTAMTFGHVSQTFLPQRAQKVRFVDEALSEQEIEDWT